MLTHYTMDMKKNKGFTIVELLIVIVVIGILAAITIVAFNGVQQRGQNANRASDIASIVKAAELYNIDNSSYPRQGAAGGMDTNFPVTVLQLPVEKIVSPTAVDGTTNSITESTATYLADPTNRYRYQARQEGGASCWSTAHICVGFEIRYRKAGDTTDTIETHGTF